MRIALFLFCFIVILCSSAPAQNTGLADRETSGEQVSSPFVPNVHPELHIQRTQSTITVDGYLDDAGWSGAARASNFSEVNPGDLTEPPVNTEVLITYDDQYLYLGFIAHDDPAAIRATLHDRDEQWSEDMVGIILDTYGNAQWAYEIFTNAKGIQGDLLWTNDDEDTRFDLVYQSQAVITSQGYQVEMAIPFSSLRFPDQAVQNWKATFWRIHPRGSRGEYSWAAINRDDPCSFCQYGSLTGIENVHPGGALELFPAVVASESGALEDPDNPASRFINDKPTFDASFGARYAFTPSLTGEITINPDFSQVESDAAQIDVNTTFALSFPERRPFFQEGSDLFGTWINAVYTRSINEPLAGAKLIGRMGNTSIGYISAYDENMGIILPFEEFSRFAAGNPEDSVPAIRSVSNILRVRHGFSDNSYIGALATDTRLVDGGSGTVAGIDGSVRFFNNFSFEGQALLSYTVEPTDNRYTRHLGDLRFNDDRQTAAFDGEKFTGYAIYASIERAARDWDLNIDYWETSPTFRALNGFVTRNSTQQLSAWANYKFYPETDLIDRIEPSAEIARIYNTDWVRKDEWFRPELEMQLTGQTSLMFAYIFSNELFRGKEFSGIRRFQMNLNSNFSNVFSGGFWLSPGRFIARGISDPVLGSGLEFNVWATIKPTEQLNIQPGVDYSELNYPNGGPQIFSVWVARARINYQFTRELSLRLVTQYDDDTQAFAIEPLLTYKINPFTVFYIGSTHALQDYPQTSGFVEKSRQFFAKVQYLVGI